MNRPPARNVGEGAVDLFQTGGRRGGSAEPREHELTADVPHPLVNAEESQVSATALATLSVSLYKARSVGRNHSPR